MLSICYVMSFLCMCKRLKARNFGQSDRRVLSSQAGCPSKGDTLTGTTTTQLRVLLSTCTLRLINVWFSSRFLAILPFWFGLWHGWEVNPRANSYASRLPAISSLLTDPAFLYSVLLLSICIFSNVTQSVATSAWLEFTIGHLGMKNAQASWLAQVGSGVLIGRSACRLLALLLLFRHSAKSQNAHD